VTRRFLNWTRPQLDSHRSEAAGAELYDARRVWLAVSDSLFCQAHKEIAAQVRLHVERMPPPLTEKEFIPRKLLERTREPRVREPQIFR
jgi:hypothetical protein